MFEKESSCIPSTTISSILKHFCANFASQFRKIVTYFQPLTKKKPTKNYGKALKILYAFLPNNRTEFWPFG